MDSNFSLDRINIDVCGNIETNFNGYFNLLSLYNEMSKYRNTIIDIDFTKLKWVDANLCAFLDAILYKLDKENSLMFASDHDYLRQHFPILFRNGFLIGDENNPIANSAVPMTCYSSDQKDEFLKYIKNDLLNHEGIAHLGQDIKSNLKVSFIEIFTNFQIHANTDYPLFACGQHFPNKKLLKFTFLDLGQGYLTKISQHTNGMVITSLDAINWALIKGNTTKTDAPGGLGLADLKQFCHNNNGILQIISDGCFWELGQNGKERHYFLPQAFPGVLINLIFNCI